MLFTNLLIAGLVAITAAFPLPMNGNGSALEAHQAALQYAGDTTASYGRVGAFVKKTVVEIGENFLEPLQIKGADKTIERRLIYVLHPGDPIPPVLIAAIVLSCIILVASIVGFGLYCCADRAWSRKTADSDAARAELAARMRAEIPSSFLKEEASTNAQNSLLAPAECVLKQEK